MKIDTRKVFQQKKKKNKIQITFYPNKFEFFIVKTGCLSLSLLGAVGTTDPTPPKVQNQSRHKKKRIFCVSNSLKGKPRCV